MSAKKETTTKAETVQAATTTASDEKKQQSTVDAMDLMNERAAKRIEQGFIGEEVDKTENRAYTIAGVIEGMETPETVEAETIETE